MKTFASLLILELRGLVASFFKTKKGKRSRLGTIGFALLLLFAFGSISVSIYFYLSALLGGLSAMGQGFDASIAFGLTVTISTVLTIITSIAGAAKHLFAYQDFDLLISMPIKHITIFASKLVTFYILQFVNQLFIVIPSIFAYSLYAPMSFGVIIRFVIMILAAPLFPMVISSVIGIIITKATTRMKKSNIARSVFTLAFMFGWMYINFTGGMAVLDDFTRVFSFIEGEIYRVYPFAGWYASGINGDYILFAQFLLINIAITVLFVMWGAKRIHSMNTALTATAPVKQGKAIQIKGQSLASTLFKRELKRYLLSSIYLVNTIPGSILLIAAGTAAIIIGRDSILNKLGDVYFMAINYVPYALMIIISIAQTTSVGISIEGTSIETLKSLPVSAKEIFVSKIKLNLLLFIPTALYAGIATAIVLKVEVCNALLGITALLLYTLSTSVAGLRINLWLPKMDWKTETEVVKQGISVLIAMIVNFVMVAIPVLVSIFVNSNIGLASSFALSLLILIGSWWSLNKTGYKEFIRL